MAESDPNEDGVRALLAAGDPGGAVAELVRTLGAELFGFVLAVVDDHAAARDVYAALTDRLLRALPRFAWSCPLRTWVYRVSREELARHRRERHRRDGSRSPPEFLAPDPTTTVSRRPKALHRVAITLREDLEEEERELLILRIGRSLGFWDLAITSLGEDASALQLACEAERLRMLLHSLRAKLSRAAAERRLLDPR